MFFAAYSAVLAAELLGDKSIYTIASLTSRFRASLVLAGVSAAFALKMLVAVLVGRAITALPSSAVAAASCAGFLFTAWTLLRDERPALPRSRGALGISFASIALTEWCDPGQLAAALLTIRTHAPLLIWTAATAALVTKGIVALGLGSVARQYLSTAWFRAAAATACGAMAVLSAIDAVRPLIAE